MIQFADLVAAAAPAADRRAAYGPGPQQFGELRVARAGTGPRPIVVLIHGGCWQAAYDLAHTRAAAAALADDGFAVWTPEYRRLGDAGGGWPGTFQDVAAAVDFVAALGAAEPSIDLARVIVAGHSAGGHLALWAASRRRAGEASNAGASSGNVAEDGTENGTASLAPPADRRITLAGVVALAAISDLAAYGAAAGECNASVAALLGGSPATVGDRYAAASPAERLPLGVPVQLVHGSADSIVPAEISERFAERARNAGDRVALSIVPGGGHFDVVAPWSGAWPYAISAIRAAAKSSSAG